MGWSITSNKSYSLGTIDDNGLATFSEHTEDIVYTVTYSDGNYTCSKAITVHACRPDCLCENVDLRAEATQAGNSIPAEGYDTDTVIGTFDDTTCLSSLTVSSTQTWVKGVRISGHNIYAQVDKNESILNTRTATITVTGKDGENVDCPDDFIITQQMSASTCTCENVDLRAEATAGGNSIPAEGYNTDTLIGTYNNGTCLTSIGVGKDPAKTWVTSLSVSNGNVYAKIDPNTSLELSREATITVSGKDAYDVTCEDPFIITQEKSAITCSCDFLTINPTSLVFSAAATSTDSQEITLTPSDSCITDIRTLGTLNYFNATIGGNKVVVSPKGKNTTTSAYTDTLVISYSASSIPCSSSVTLTQEGVGACTCSCITLSKPNPYVFSKSASTETIGILGYRNEECKTACQGNVTFQSKSAGLTDIHLESDGVTIKGNLSKAEMSRVLSYKVLVDGVACKTGSVYQRCWRGTDNGVDVFYDDSGTLLREEHPILLCGGMHNNHYDADSDAIAVAGVQILKPNGSWADISSIAESDNLVYGGWLKVYWTTDSSIGCPYGSIVTQALSANDSGSVRGYTIQLKTTAATPTICSSAQHGGQEACNEWEYPVLQAPRCYGWCKIGDGENRKALTYDARVTTCAAAYPDLWNAAVAAGEAHSQNSCYPNEPASCPDAPQSNCSDGNTNGLGDTCVSSAETSTEVKIGSWNKTPSDCPQVWTYDSSRSISGNLFIDLASLDFASDGYIYGKISESNPSSNQRECKIPTNLGSVKTDYFTVIQCGNATPPPAQSVTYTVRTDSDGNGAGVSLWQDNGGGSATNVYNGSIRNGSCTFTTNTNYGNLTVIIGKTNCTFTSTSGSNSVAPNGTVTFTSNCSTPVQCQVSLNLISSAPAAGGTMYIGEWHTTGSCTNPTTLTYVSGDGNFLSSIDVRSNNGIYANVAQNTSTSSRTSKYRITYGTATAEANITQLGATPPTTYTYTINSTDDNANGAYAIFVNEGSIVTQIAIANRTCTFTSSTYYPVLYVAVSKTGYKTVNTTVNANSSTNITMTSCASETYDTSSIVTQYLDISQNDSLEISYPSVGDCWTPSIYYLAGGSSVKSEVFGDRKVTLKFKDNIEIACYLLFTNKGDSSNRVATGTIHITFND